MHNIRPAGRKRPAGVKPGWGPPQPAQYVAQKWLCFQRCSLKYLTSRLQGSSAARAVGPTTWKGTCWFLQVPWCTPAFVCCSECPSTGINFDSRYICEQAFFVMKLNNSKLHLQLTGDHLRSVMVEYGLTAHRTHYRSYRGRVITDQMTQPTVSKHWRKVLRIRRQSHQIHPTML